MEQHISDVEDNRRHVETPRSSRQLAVPLQPSPLHSGTTYRSHTSALTTFIQTRTIGPTLEIHHSLSNSRGTPTNTYPSTFASTVLSSCDTHSRFCAVESHRPPNLNVQLNLPEHWKCSTATCRKASLPTSTMRPS